MKFKYLLVLSLISMPALAQLKSMASEDMDAILSDTGEFTSQTYQQRISIKANFNVGTANGKVRDCSNQKPRRNTSFYPCWNGQSKDFLSKVAFTLRHQKSKTTKSHFTFNLNRKGQLENIKIRGVKDQATRNQLSQLLKKMEFGYEHGTNLKTVYLSVTTKDTN